MHPLEDMDPILHLFSILGEWIYIKTPIPWETVT